MEEQKPPKVNLMAPVGVSGLPHYSGYVYSEWLTELQGPRGRRVYREMQDNDPVIGGLLFALEHLMRQVDWSVEDHPDASSHDERTDFVEGCREDMALPWPDTISEIMTFLPWGFAPCEINYKRRTKTTSQFDDGRIGWDGWPLRGQETLLHWAFDEYGGVVAMHQLGPPDFKEHVIPIEKLLLFRTTVRQGNPEGRSILRTAYKSWYYLKHLQAVEAIGAERDLCGIPTFWVPPEVLTPDAAGQEQQALTDFKTVGKNLRSDEEACLVMPLVYDEKGNKLYDVALMGSAGNKQYAADAIITRYEKRVAMSVMGQFLFLGQDNVGTQALGQTMSDIWTTAFNSFLDMICSQVNEQAIPRLLRLNGMDTYMAPRLIHGEVAKPDLATIGQFLKSIGTGMSGAGISLDTRVDGDLAKRLMEEAGLPPPPDATDLPSPPAPAGALSAPNPNAGPNPPGSELPPATTDDEADDIYDSLDTATKPVSRVAAERPVNAEMAPAQEQLKKDLAATFEQVWGKRSGKK